MVNILKQLDNAVNYIEANLCNEIDMDELARIVCITPDSFLRFFSYTGKPGKGHSMRLRW